MEKLQIPAWILAIALLLFSLGYFVSLFWLDEQRMFAGMEFGPKESKDHHIDNYSVNVNGRELPSNGGNVKTDVCPEGSYMIGNRFQIDGGGPHGIVSSIYPVCRTINVSLTQ